MRGVVETTFELILFHNVVTTISTQDLHVSIFEEIFKKCTLGNT